MAHALFATLSSVAVLVSTPPAEAGLSDPRPGPKAAPKIVVSPSVPKRPSPQARPIRRATPPDPLDRLAKANARARVHPRPEAYANAVQVYAFDAGALYQIYASPGRVTDIALQPREKLVGTGALAAGDTTRWIIGDTESGQGDDQRVHVLIKPTRAGLVTNLVINTDRRTYHLELRARPGAYMAAVSWRYPLDEARLAAEARRLADAQAQASPERRAVATADLNFAYRIQGRARWRPLRVYDDGRQTFIEFAPSVAEGDMPPLFVLGPGKTIELVNYRVHGQRMIVDRLFEAAELRLGDRRARQTVKLIRVGSLAR